jgi:hypothetical protein
VCPRVDWDLANIVQITLPVTVGTRENFHIEIIQFEVADFKITYNAFLGRSTLFKFMTILHYVYLVLKMPGPHGVISIRGDVKRVFDYDRESCEIVDRLMTSAKLRDLKQALTEFPPPPSDPVMPEVKTSIQLEDSLRKTVPLSTEESIKVAHVDSS